MTTTRQQNLNDAITKAIAEPKQSNALYNCMKRGRDKRTERLLTLPGGTAFRDEVTAVTNSGRDVPSAMSVRPTIIGGMPRRSDTPTAPLTRIRLPKTTIPAPIKRSVTGS